MTTISLFMVCCLGVVGCSLFCHLISQSSGMPVLILGHVVVMYAMQTTFRRPHRARLIQRPEFVIQADRS